MNGRLAAAAAVAALAAGGAAAQWRPEPMIVRLDRADEVILAGNLDPATPGDDLLVLYGTSTAQVRPWRKLLQPGAPYAFPRTIASRSFRTAHLPQAGGPGDALADLVTHTPPGIDYVLGSDPSVVHTCALNPPANDSGRTPDWIVTGLELLARAPGPAGRPQTLVMPYWLYDAPRKIYLLDVGATLDPCAQTTLAVPPQVSLWPQDPEAYPVRLSAVARANAVDDLAVPMYGGVLLYTQRTGPMTSLATLDLDGPIFAGTIVDAFTRPAFFPVTVRGTGYALGVAALDVDLDGQADLVFTQANELEGWDPQTGATIEGEIVWVRGTGTPRDFANPSLTPWHDLAAEHPELGLADPLIVRPLDLAGLVDPGVASSAVPAAAIWDRNTKEVVVVWADHATGQLASWRAPAPGRRAVDIRLADLAGSILKDLVVTMRNGSNMPDTVLVYPDLGDASPVLAWAAGSPGSPVRGLAHAMAVTASDADGSPAVEWILGPPTTAPVATGLSYAAAATCAVPPPPLEVWIRATDEWGVWTELSATLPVQPLTPEVSIRGAIPPGRLVLPPGGTTAVLDGVVATGCGAPAWSDPWPLGTTFTDTVGPASVVRTVDLPEAVYPALLADPAIAVSLSTTDPYVAPVTTLALELDASGLVELRHASDRATLAEGDLAVLRTTLRSRIGVPLPRVRLAHVLSGLEPAGPPAITGAPLRAVREEGAVVVLDLPPAPAIVTVELPVRSVGKQGASAVEARSSGGWLVSPPARATDAAPVLPGCGCAGGEGGGASLLWLAAAFRPRRRRCGRSEQPRLG